jgi:hypothetical protein
MCEGKPPKQGGLYKALAFNTLLSSQETDTHHQATPNKGKLSGATLQTYQELIPRQIRRLTQQT